MYYPYFRSKQFDLLALSSLLDAGKLSQKIIPIIEPVKQSKALFKLLDKFLSAEQLFYLIVNPQAGEFVTIDGLSILKNLEFPKALILDQPLETIEEKFPLLIVKSSQAVLASDWSANSSLVLVPEEIRLLAKISGPKILSQDVFTRLPSNSFYTEIPDELFSIAFASFQQRGFKGFSDFSIDSRIYYPHSYPSKRIALHLVYRAENNLRIHHFISDDELETQKEKFLQVMEEVALWGETLWGMQPTLGGKILLDALKQAHFPGMGVLRKASVMHHLEIMSRLLDEL